MSPKDFCSANLHIFFQNKTKQTDRQTDRRRNGHTVETGHNVGLTAITSKVIWTPDGRRQNHRKREGESVEQREKMQEKEKRVKAKVRERGGKESRENIRTTAQLCTAEAEDPTGGTTVSISGQT